MNQEELCRNYVEKVLEEQIPQNKEERSKELFNAL